MSLNDPQQDPSTEMSQTSFLSQAHSWIHALPIVTRTIFVICTFVYIVFNLLLGWNNLGIVCIGLPPIISHIQLWRLITAPFVHANLLHIAFNMLALLSIGSLVEQNIASTSKYLSLILLLLVFGDILYLLLAFLASLLPLTAPIATQCAVGFSGVIFGLIPVEIGLSRATHRSLFGLVSMPAFIYPWALLVFWQFLVPQSSFLGHLSGLALGEIYCYTTGLNRNSLDSVFGRFGIGITGTNYQDESTPLVLPLHHHQGSSSGNGNGSGSGNGNGNGVIEKMKEWWARLLSHQNNNNRILISDEAHTMGSSGVGNANIETDDGMSRGEKAGAAASAAEARMLRNT